MTVATPAPPPLDAGLEQLPRRMRLPHMRRIAPEVLATATVDRLMHHAHVCQTSGDSIRLTQDLSGKGVKPLN